MTQFIVARRQVFNHAHRSRGFTDLRQRAVKLRQWKQFWVRKGRGKRQYRGVAAGLQDFKNIGIDINGVVRHHLRRCGNRARDHRTWGDIITGLRTRHDASLAFQQLIGVAHGHKTHPAIHYLLAQRRQFVARLPYPKGYLFRHLLSEALVLFHG